MPGALERLQISSSHPFEPFLLLVCDAPVAYSSLRVLEEFLESLLPVVCHMKNRYRSVFESLWTPSSRNIPAAAAVRSSRACATFSRWKQVAAGPNTAEELVLTSPPPHQDPRVMCDQGMVYQQKCLLCLQPLISISANWGEGGESSRLLTPQETNSEVLQKCTKKKPTRGLFRLSSIQVKLVVG